MEDFGLIILQCPIEDCRFHKMKIPGSQSLLKNHIFKDHDYLEKLTTAAKLGLIENLEEHRSPQWFADKLSDLGIIRD